MATELLNDKRDCDTKENIRRMFYKKPISKDNIKLEFDETTPQEERRRILLEYQKQCRDEVFNSARGILEETYFSELENEELMEDEESIDEEQRFSRFSRNINHTNVFRKNPMMLSEWMIDVPEDLTENWIMIPCPKGKRIRIVSHKGKTKAFTKKGNLCDYFHSALPGGNSDFDTHYQDSAVLDCIWIQKQKVFYVLDVLQWRILPLSHCEAEFRRYWINSQMHEIKKLRERNTDSNKYPILPLPNIACDSNLSSALECLDSDLHPLDGLLFYHRHGKYSFGSSPLVTWLKPFMLSEVFGISVPPEFEQKPEDYIDFEHHLNSVKPKSRQKRKNAIKNLMEIEQAA